MLRLCGGLCVFLAMSYCGFYFSGRLKKRRDFLVAIADALMFIQSEIEFGRFDLKNIFIRINDSAALCNFFGRCAELTEDNTIQNAWINAVEECKDKAYLKQSDTDTLLQLGRQIGMSDVVGQKAAIKRTVTHLDQYAKSADEDYQRLGKPYRSCGILLGVFCLIIVI